MKKTILIYDDDEEILILCKAILKRFDYNVETLSRCENILSDIQAIKPDIVLMDLWIPVIGGEKAISIAKQDDITRAVPILVFSANADIQNIALKINADGYVEKPFEINALVQMIQKHLA